MLLCLSNLDDNRLVLQSKFVEELSQKDRIRELILDQYANYVVQRALTVANNEEGLKLVNAIRPHLHSMQVLCVAFAGQYGTGATGGTDLDPAVQSHPVHRRLLLWISCFCPVCVALRFLQMMLMVSLV